MSGSAEKCRVCAAGPAGQRLHLCPNSPYYIPGSDPAAEISAASLPTKGEKP